MAILLIFLYFFKRFWSFNGKNLRSIRFIVSLDVCINFYRAWVIFEWLSLREVNCTHLAKLLTKTQKNPPPFSEEPVPPHPSIHLASGWFHLHYSKDPNKCTANIIVIILTSFCRFSFSDLLQLYYIKTLSILQLNVVDWTPYYCFQDYDWIR